MQNVYCTSVACLNYKDKLQTWKVNCTSVACGCLFKVQSQRKKCTVHCTSVACGCLFKVCTSQRKKCTVHCTSVPCQNYKVNS